MSLELSVIGWLAWTVAACLAVSNAYGIRHWARRGQVWHWATAVQAASWWAIAVGFLIIPINKLHILWLLPAVFFGSVRLVVDWRMRTLQGRDVPVVTRIILSFTRSCMRLLLYGTGFRPLDVRMPDNTPISGGGKPGQEAPKIPADQGIIMECTWCQRKNRVPDPPKKEGKYLCGSCGEEIKVTPPNGVEQRQKEKPPKKCPRCGRLNSDLDLHCACGFDLVTDAIWISDDSLMRQIVEKLFLMRIINHRSWDEIKAWLGETLANIDPSEANQLWLGIQIKCRQASVLLFFRIAREKGMTQQAATDFSGKWTDLTNFWFSSVNRPVDKAFHLLRLDANPEPEMKLLISEIERQDPRVIPYIGEMRRTEPEIDQYLKTLRRMQIEGKPESEMNTCWDKMIFSSWDKMNFSTPK